MGKTISVTAHYMNFKVTRRCSEDMGLTVSVCFKSIKSRGFLIDIESILLRIQFIHRNMKILWCVLSSIGRCFSFQSTVYNCTDRQRHHNRGGIVHRPSMKIAFDVKSLQLTSLNVQLSLCSFLVHGLQLFTVMLFSFLKLRS